MSIHRVMMCEYVQHPWNVTFLHMTGHMYIKDKHGNAEKIYFIVFVCGATGSGHIEVCVDASSEAFANSFERFSARRGIPSLVISDQGLNFNGYYNELTKISNDSVVKKFLIKPQINDWVLIKDDSRDLRIGKILTLIISDDGEVRSVKVKTKSHEGIYPVTNLRFLEFHNPNVTNHTEELKGSEVMPKARPKRAAAEKANNAMKNYA